MLLSLNRLVGLAMGLSCSICSLVHIASLIVVAWIKLLMIRRMYLLVLTEITGVIHRNL